MLRSEERCYGRCRAACQQHSTVLLKPLKCNFHGIVFRRHIGFISGFVLLVDDDQPYAVQRCKYRRSGADHDVHLPISDPHPFIVSLSHGKPAVEHRYSLCSESADESVDHLGCQGDFRHKHYHLSAGLYALFRSPHVDFRLAAAGHPVKQVPFVRSCIQCSFHRSQRCLLLISQLRTLTGFHLDILERIPHFAPFGLAARRGEAFYPVYIFAEIPVFHPSAGVDYFLTEAYVLVQRIDEFQILVFPVRFIRHAEHVAFPDFVASGEGNIDLLTHPDAVIFTTVSVQHIGMLALVVDYYICVFHYSPTAGRCCSRCIL